MKKKEEIKKLLVVVDMVNGFIREGNMADPGIANILPAIRECIESSRCDGLAFIRDSHPEDAAEFQKFPVHCLSGTSESELVDELKEYAEGALDYEKNSTSAVFAPGFLEDIESMSSLEEVIISGCCTDICVMNLAMPLTNYFDQNNRKVLVRAPRNLTETYDAPVHPRADYNEMANRLMELSGVKTEELK
ncbi:MAG: cysteine hydrolase [Erysipelotrichaceae bacterium]|nr:cysteine hydrolase [Erysipelotrichaceae bacterium]MBR3168591.1 cysteine hydrolase [Erysipelotrichaceae bacterium]